MDKPLRRALIDTGAEDFINLASEKFLARPISSELSDAIKQERPERLLRLGYVYEREGVQGYLQWIRYGSIRIRQSANGQEVENKIPIFTEHIAPIFGRAFFCWRALLNLDGESSTINEKALELINEELASEQLPPSHSLALHLSVSGVLALRTAEVRLELKKWNISNENHNDDWRQMVLTSIIEAFVLLTRKDNGWNDIDAALQRIARLRDLQEVNEEDYITGNGGDREQVKAAIDLVALYHLAQLVNLTVEYLQTGQPSVSSLNMRLDRHHDRALAAFETSGGYMMQHIADLLWIGCRETIQNSIWTHAATLPPRVREFIKLLAERGRPKPIIELWPAQQEALARNVLTTYHRAVLVEMPTSAGKTLLAKFSIVQTKALNPEGTIAYIVPTRALVNQVTFDLRSDFRGLNPPLQVEMTVPAFELDPTEDLLLQKPPDVLVTTPEKLDLLIRSDHPAVSNLSMIVADEAHNIQEEGRGPRLELLLGTLKRDRPEARFLLLSPFLLNNEEILTWLGEGMALPAIDVDWKPGNRIVGAIDVRGRYPKRRLVFETLPAADNSNVKERWTLDIGSDNLVPQKRTIKLLTKYTVQSLRDRGSILVLCRGRGTAITRAQEIAEDMETIPETPELRAVCAYLRAEAGMETPLIRCLKRGVAYHHAGISHEARWLLEVLIKKDIVNVVCGTTTLAQGVNFPISTVIVETLKKGTVSLSYEDFWNIAGRAGRTLMDSVGLVGFPTPTPDKRNEVEQFLQGEAEDIVSQLASLIDRADQIGTEFNMAVVSKNPNLSTLLQFLAHAMRVAGRTDMADEVEDIMRASLVYHQVRTKSEDAANKLLSLCRMYLMDLSQRSNVMGLLAQADTTGFCTPSVLGIHGKLQESDYSHLREVSFWQPSDLFKYGSENLTRQIEVIGSIPEIRLGHGKEPPFNPNHVADILRDWVNGLPLYTIAQEQHIGDNRDPEKQLTEFSEYLFRLIGIASWGIGALEGLCLSKATDAEWQDVGYVPSMIFYGVKHKEAVWLRMIGVPRILADGLAEIWRERDTPSPSSYDEIRNWVNNLSDHDWAKTIPTGIEITPEQCRFLWQTLKG